ncbi:histidine kinase [Gramella lutea]|uniref:Histidine kinase n=1 Tax=Christiangramia lutea TaxID=1607951 RepID=A0A9X2ABH5_9FLAO|nr:histidine kinase [Christiangramia lutea]MCH4824246.1 histidine kinase [Christiangramia lutea]
MSFSTLKQKYIDFKLVLLLAGFYLLFDIVLLVKVSYMQAYMPREYGHFNWPDFLINNVLFDYIIVVSYMTLIAISTKRFLNKNYSWVKIISIHTVFSILIGLIIRLIFDFYSILVGKIDLANFDLRRSINAFVFVMDLNFLIYFAMVFIIYTYYYLKQVKEAEKRHSKLESQLVNTRMKMLSSQLQPHFLFNTLNSIAVLTDMDTNKAKDTIADLSDFLREILYNSDRNRISLDEELRILEYYLNIVNVRFSDHLHIKKEIDDSLLLKRVPAMLLQPVIENSIKHGYSYDHTDLNILVSIYEEGKMLVIKVENDGEPVSETHAELMKKGVGLKNIDDRLRNLYKEDYFFEIRNKEDNSGVETIIKVPE